MYSHAVCVGGRTCPYVCVCVCLSGGVLVRMSVCVCVCVLSGGIRVLAYNYDTHLILFFTFLYPKNLLPGHITQHFLASSTSMDVNTNLSQDDHSNVYSVV